MDIEQGGKTEISEDYWLTDITLSHNSWSYVQNQTYKEPDLLIRLVRRPLNRLQRPNFILYFVKKPHRTFGYAYVFCRVQNKICHVSLNQKPTNKSIRNMINVWSKRGIVLLNVSPRADGVIPDAQRVVLKAIGEWIDKHQQAVYGTRAHDIFGYGVAAFEKGPNRRSRTNHLLR